MLAPKSWLQEYVPITLETKKLAERLTEVGLNTEKMEKIKDELKQSFKRESHSSR